MRLRAVLLGCLVFAGCSRCGSAGPRDAGTHVKRSTDLRTALFDTFPEYRNAHVEDARALLVRDYAAPLTPQAFADAAKQLGYVPAEDGGFTKNIFRLAQAGPARAEVSLELDDEAVAKIFTAPLAMSTLELGLYLPRAPVEREVFSLEVHYIALTHRRAGVLARQLPQLLLANGQWELARADGWSPLLPDGGVGASRILPGDVPSVNPEAAVEKVNGQWISGPPDERLPVFVGSLLPTFGERLLELVDGKRTVRELVELLADADREHPREEVDAATLQAVDLLVQKSVLVLEIPDAFTVELRERAPTPGVVTVRRDARRVHTRFELVTDHLE